MSVGIVAASTLFLALASVSVGTQEQGAFEHEFVVVEGTFKSVGGTTVPIACPPETECIDPWAKQNQTDLIQPPEGIDTSPDLDTLMQGNTRGTLRDWQLTGGVDTSGGGY